LHGKIPVLLDTEQVNSGRVFSEKGAPFLDNRGFDDYLKHEIYLKGRSISMKIRPLHDRLIVKRLEEEEKTKGGIIIPDTAKEKPIEGKVIAAGEGRLNKDGKKIAMEVKTGDRILFAKYAGTEVKMDGEEYLMMKEDDVLAVIEK
jgi:chaperonin GroES